MEAPKRFFELNITVLRGTDYPLVLRFKDGDGTPVDITNFEFTLVVKRSANDETAIFTIPNSDVVKSASAATTDTATLLITETHTDISPRDYDWSVKIVNGSDDWGLGVGLLAIKKKA